MVLLHLDLVLCSISCQEQIYKLSKKGWNVSLKGTIFLTESTKQKLICKKNLHIASLCPRKHLVEAEDGTGHKSPYANLSFGRCMCELPLNSQTGPSWTSEH